MKAEVGKSFTFHAAHQLLHHDGLCKNLHGHTYTVEVIVHGKIQDATLEHDGEEEIWNPKEGMVIDFGDLKKTWETIKPSVDHVNLNDTLGPEIGATTSEQIALWLFQAFKNSHPEVTAIKLWETPTSYALIRQGDVIRR